MLMIKYVYDEDDDDVGDYYNNNVDILWSLSHH